MSTKAPWSSQYMIQRTDSLTAAPTFAATAIGVEGTGSANGIFRLPLTNSPHIVPSSGTIEHATTTGRSEMYSVLDYSQVVGEPGTVTLEMPMNAYNLALFLILLFQDGCSETDAATMILKATSYTAAAPTYFSSIVRVMVDDFATKPNADTVSHILYGAICKSLTITGSENDILRLSAEMAGSWGVAAASTDLTANPPEILINNSTTNYNAFGFFGSGQEASRAPIKFQDCTTKIGTYGSESAATFDNFSIKISNNAVHRYYASSSINAWVMGRNTGEGSIRVPWGDANYGGNNPLNDFVDGTDFGFRLYNTEGATADNTFDIHLNVRATDTSISTDPEVQTELSFSPVYDGTNAAFTILAGYNKTYLDHGLPATV